MDLSLLQSSYLSQDEIDFIISAQKKGYGNVNGVDLVQTYYDALTNGGPVEGVNYAKNDVNLLRQSPVKVTPRVQGVSGARQPITDDCIDLMFFALQQQNKIKETEVPYFSASCVCGSIKAHLRTSQQQYQAVCEKVFAMASDPRKFSIEEIRAEISPLFPAITQEDIKELKDAVARGSKVEVEENNTSVLIPGTEDRYVFGSYRYHTPFRKDDQLAFCRLLGDIEPGKKGGFLRPAAPDRFLGIDPAKLKVYKDILEAALPREIQETVNREYKAEFTISKLIPDYLFLQKELGKDPAEFCNNINKYGGEEIIPELLRHYQVASVQDVYNAFRTELKNQRAFDSAVLNAQIQSADKDREWNEHVRQTTQGHNVLVSQPLRDKYTRDTTSALYKADKKDAAETMAKLQGLAPSQFLRPKS